MNFLVCKCLLAKKIVHSLKFYEIRYAIVQSYHLYNADFFHNSLINDMFDFLSLLVHVLKSVDFGPLFPFP